MEQLENRRLLAAVWQNADDAMDVDGSEIVSNIDALLVINELNERRSGVLPASIGDPGPPRFVDTNGDGWLSPIDALLVINALNEPRAAMAVTAHLSPESDPNGNGVVLSSPVTVIGQTLAKARIVLAVAPEGESASAGESAAFTLRAIADATGRYAVSVPLGAGKSTIDVSARGRFGETATSRHVVRLGDAVLDWNAAALNVIRDWTTTSNDPYPNRIVTSQPPIVARNLAMIHVAMNDAVNAVKQTQAPIHVDRAALPGTSALAAGAAAAHRVASGLYRDADELAVWDATLAETLASVPEGPGKTQGLTLGREIGDAILAWRANDGAKAIISYTSGIQPGDWNRTFPDYLPPLLPQWPQVKPFAMTSGDQFRPVPPPPLTSTEYAIAVEEVMRLGSFDNSARTAEQTEIALFWADGGGTFTPPGHWNQIAADVALQRGTSLDEKARLFAVLNVALADAGIAAWDAKYAYDFWRPIDAIRRADSDGNPATTAKATWIPLIKTPPFPTYTSGHSTFSGAADAVLSQFFGNDVAFTSESDGHIGFAQRPLATGLVVSRSFGSFSEAANEAGLSRIYGGIHFSFDNIAGLAAGRALGSYVVDTLSKPHSSP